MTNSELTSEQLENAMDIEMETFDLITNIVKKSFAKERMRRHPIKIVKITRHESTKKLSAKKIKPYFKAQKKSQA